MHFANRGGRETKVSFGVALYRRKLCHTFGDIWIRGSWVLQQYRWYLVESCIMSRFSHYEYWRASITNITWKNPCYSPPSSRYYWKRSHLSSFLSWSPCWYKVWDSWIIRTTYLWTLDEENVRPGLCLSTVKGCVAIVLYLTAPWNILNYNAV